MIRAYREKDLSEVMQIWLYTNIKAHNFIPEKYWLENYAIVKTLLPQAEIYVYESDDTGQIDGFVGLTDNYIEGIFVREAAQSRGIGKQLMNYIKENKTALKLSVYRKNTGAISFYRKNGFVIQSENIDDNTDEKEFTMTWTR